MIVDLRGFGEVKNPIFEVVWVQYHLLGGFLQSSKGFIWSRTTAFIEI